MTTQQLALMSQRELTRSGYEIVAVQPWFQQSHPYQTPEPDGVWEPARIGTYEPDLTIWSDRD